MDIQYSSKDLHNVFIVFKVWRRNDGCVQILARHIFLISISILWDIFSVLGSQKV